MMNLSCVLVEIVKRNMIIICYFTISRGHILVPPISCKHVIPMSFLIQDMIDIDGLTEANGMIGDLLFQEERLTQKGRESLKKIQQLLMVKNHGFSVQYLPRSRLGSNESDVTSGASSYSPNTRRVSFVSLKYPGMYTCSLEYIACIHSSVYVHCV